MLNSKQDFSNNELDTNSDNNRLSRERSEFKRYREAGKLRINIYYRHGYRHGYRHLLTYSLVFPRDEARVLDK